MINAVFNSINGKISLRKQSSKTCKYILSNKLSVHAKNLNTVLKTEKNDNAHVLRGVYSDTNQLNSTQLNSGQRPVYDVINNKKPS